jgi:hypothetical protein
MGPQIAPYGDADYGCAQSVDGADSRGSGAQQQAVSVGPLITRITLWPFCQSPVLLNSRMFNRKVEEVKEGKNQGNNRKAATRLHEPAKRV